MYIVCPECSSAYNVPEKFLTAPRSLRCTHCDTVWMVDLSSGNVPKTANASLEDEAPEAAATAFAEVDEAERKPAASNQPEEKAVQGEVSGKPGEVPGDAAPGGIASDRPRLSRETTDMLASREVAAARRGTLALWSIAWIVSLSIVAVGGWAFWHFHAVIEHVWPPTERLFTYCAQLSRPA